MHRCIATNPKFIKYLHEFICQKRICVKPNSLGGASCYNLPLFFSSLPTTLLQSGLPRAPIFTFSCALYPFPPTLTLTSCSHHFLHSTYLLWLIFRPPDRLTIPGSMYLRLILSKDSHPCYCHLVKVAAPMYIS